MRKISNEIKQIYPVPKYSISDINAYRSIHDVIVPYWHIIAGSALSWSIQMPDAKAQLFK